MKKLLFAIMLLTVMVAAFSSCASSRKSGCPGTEGIIH